MIKFFAIPALFLAFAGVVVSAAVNPSPTAMAAGRKMTPPPVEAPIAVEIQPGGTETTLPTTEISKAEATAHAQTARAAKTRTMQCGAWEDLATSTVQKVKRCEYR